MIRWVIMCLTFFYILLIRIRPSLSNSYDELCTSVISKDYKLFESPNKDSSVRVYNRFQILDIGEINEENMDYLFHTFYTAVWRDPRIRVNDSLDPTIPVFLPKECLEYFWQPSIFFETAKTIELFKTSAPVIILKVYSDGKVSITKRYLFRSSCHMNFQYYPFDSQMCEFYIALIPPDSECVLSWCDEEGSPMKNWAPVKILRDIQPLQYYLGNIKSFKFVDSLPDANYTSLTIGLAFDRRLIGSLINTYIPSTLIVSMSFVSFWLGVEAVPARVGLSVTSLLTLCTQTQQYQSQLPPVNYIKAMDIWLFVCIFLVFSTLLEFAIAYNSEEAKRKHEKERRNNQVEAANNPQPRISWTSREAAKDKGSVSRRKSSSSSEASFDSREPSKVWQLFESRWEKWKQKRIDEHCQILYPTFFSMFVVFYWVYYLRIYYRIH